MTTPIDGLYIIIKKKIDGHFLYSIKKILTRDMYL